jgi:hypothetical protein
MSLFFRERILPPASSIHRRIAEEEVRASPHKKLRARAEAHAR